MGSPESPIVRQLCALLLSSSFVMPPSKLRAVIVPGNGGGDTLNANFYGWLAKKLRQHPLFGEVELRDMPDPERARRQICELA